MASDGYFNNVIIRRRDWCWTIRWQRNGSLKERHRETSRSKGCRLRVINILTTVPVVTGMHHVFESSPRNSFFFPAIKLNEPISAAPRFPFVTVHPPPNPLLRVQRSTPITTPLFVVPVRRIYYNAVWRQRRDDSFPLKRWEIVNNFDNNKGILKGIISRKKLIFIKGGTFNQSWPIFHQQSNTKELH